MEKWQKEIETILEEHDQGDKEPLWLKMIEELLELTRKVEAPSGAIGLFTIQVLNKIMVRKLSPLVATYTGFRLGVAYERYQNANKA